MFRATLKSLLARKLRLFLSGLAVLLGVMFVSGSFVLTDTLGRSFDNMFASSLADTDVLVTAKPAIDVSEMEGESVPGLLTRADRDAVAAVPGVAKAIGSVQADGARLIGSDGKVVATYGPPRFGANWTGEGAGLQLREGRGPAGDDEIAVNVALATAAGVKVGERVAVLTNQPKQMFTLVGTFGYEGGMDALGGVQEVRFTDPVAQRLMLGSTDAYTSFAVNAAAGTDAATLRDRLRATFGDKYVVQTGAEAAAAISAGFKAVLDVLNKVLLGFAGVALFVSAFLILNTFSILVAQRTKELALNRALGASRAQVIGSVLIEATVIGLVASVLGLAAGVGVGALLAMVAANMSSLVMAGVGVPVSAVIAAFAIGLLVTWAAALLPAIRASRIAPVAALQESATPDRPLTRLTVSGAIVATVGSGLLAYGLFGDDSNALWLVLGGVAVAFIGVALLSPVLARPVVALLGRLFSWSIPGKLGRLNSARNPRRTAITAAALMIGIALVTGANTVLASADKSVRGTAEEQVQADLIVFGQGSPDMLPSFDPALIDRFAAVPGVQAVAAEYGEQGLVGGERRYVSAVTDLPAYAKMFSLTATGGGPLPALQPYEFALDHENAQEAKLSVGDTVKVQMPRGEEKPYRLTAIYQESSFARGVLASPSIVEGMRSQQPTFGFVDVAAGTNPDTVKATMTALLADNPEMSVADRQGYLDTQLGQTAQFLLVLQVLLGLAILIAVLGVINTMALSVLERTRELGLLRAIGLSRMATMRMITVEAVVITLFGALLGMGVGVGIGAAVVRAMRNDGLTTLALPWQQLGVYLALGAFAGVLAAVLPAIRAARINVLGAIAHD